MATTAITGGTKGIGKATAARFAPEMDQLILAYKEDDQTAATTQEELTQEYDVNVETVHLDVSKTAACKKFVRQFSGTIDILINNAGILHAQPTDEQKAQMAMTKLNAVYEFSEHAHEFGLDSMVNLSSLLTANNSGAPFATAYQAGVESLTRHYAKQYKGSVRVNCVRPGYTRTDMVTQTFDHNSLEPYLDTVPDNKLMEPAAVARVIHYMATEPACTGQILTADNGATLDQVIGGDH